MLDQRVSEGFAPRVFEPPQQDLTKAQPRYLTIMGNLVEPQTAVDRPLTKPGGIEITNPCLRYAKHFIRKGRITPLLRDTHDFMPYDWVKKMVDGEPTENGWFRQTVPAGFAIPNLPPPRGTGYGTIPSPAGNMVGKFAYPGDQIGWILEGNANIYEGMRRGVVELKSLRNWDYNPKDLGNGITQDAEIWKVQIAIFPTYPILPILLEDLRRLIDEAKIHTSIRGVVDDYEQSLDQFENYASTTVQNAEAKMREIAANNDRGYIPKYTPLDLVLIEQLGLKRKDRAELQAAATSNPKLENMFEQWLQVSLEEKQANLERMKRTGEVVEPVGETYVPADYPNETTMMAQPGDAGQPGQSGASGTSGQSGQITNATPEGQEQMSVAMADTRNAELDCVCGKQAGSKAGLLAHQRHCEVAQARAESVKQLNAKLSEVQDE